MPDWWPYWGEGAWEPEETIEARRRFQEEVTWSPGRKHWDIPDDMPPIRRMLLALYNAGVTPLLAGAMLDWPPRESIQDWAEEAALHALIVLCRVDEESPGEMALARTQARYARKLKINFAFLEKNLDRNLARRPYGPIRRRKHHRPHAFLGVMTWWQRAAARELWEGGKTHGLTFHRACCTTVEGNEAVYRRAHRVIKQALALTWAEYDGPGKDVIEAVGSAQTSL